MAQEERGKGDRHWRIDIRGQALEERYWRRSDMVVRWLNMAGVFSGGFTLAS